MDDILKQGKYFHYVEKAPLWLGISVIVIIMGIVFMVVNATSERFGTNKPFNLSIHYLGGQKLILEMAEEVEPDGQNVKSIVSGYADGEPIVQVDQTNHNKVTIRMRFAVEGETESARSKSAIARRTEMKRELGEAYGGYVSSGDDQNPRTLEEDFVGPTVGSELIMNAVWALIIGCILIMLYILLRFGRWQMSLAAIGALIHDVMITLGITAMLGLEVSDSFIAVILTIIGYSINDTIIIFDRIRENLRDYQESYPLAQICNLSLNQTLVRSLNTTITVIIIIVALLIVGGANIRDFLVAMLIGMISGGYSSIFVATPLMLWLSRGKITVAPATAVTDDTAGSPEAAAVASDTVDEMIEKSAADKQADDETKKKPRKKQRRR
jgi:preprotein translocase subunit SecF